MRIRIAALLGLWLVASIPVRAEDKRLNFSAHLTLGYLRYDGLAAESERGELTNALYAIQISGKVNERVEMRTEIESEDSILQLALQPGYVRTPSLEPRVIVARSRIRLAAALNLDVGVLKQPLSFYNELRNVGIAYPYAQLPSLYQPLFGIMEPNMRGAALNYRDDLGPGEIEASVYYGWTQLFSGLDEKGRLATDRLVIDPAIPLNEQTPTFKRLTLRNLTGGLLGWSHPDWGLRFRGGGYGGWYYKGTRETGWSSWIAGLDWDTRWVKVGGEYGRQNDRGENYYATAGVKPLGELLAYGYVDRYDGNRMAPDSVFYRAWSWGLCWNPWPEVAVKFERQEIESTIFTLAFQRQGLVHNYMLSLSTAYF